MPRPPEPAWWCGSCAADARSPAPVDAPGAPPTASGSAPRGGQVATGCDSRPARRTAASPAPARCLSSAGRAEDEPAPRSAHACTEAHEARISVTATRSTEKTPLDPVRRSPSDPGLLGLSLRVPHAYGRDRHQDLLRVTSADYPLLHHIFLPALDVHQRPYTSSLPYRASGELFLVGALPRRESPRPDGRDEFDRLHIAASTGRLEFDLAVAPVAGRFRSVGSLRIGQRLGPELDALRFNPWNSGGGMQPAGWLNHARDPAYKLSQRTWRRLRRHGAIRQDAADHELERLARTSLADGGTTHNKGQPEMRRPARHQPAPARDRARPRSAGRVCLARRETHARSASQVRRVGVYGGQRCGYGAAMFSWS